MSDRAGELAKMLRVVLSVAVVIALLPAFVLPVFSGVAGQVTRELIEAAAERAAARSGRKLVEHATKRSAQETLERLIKTYGDDALEVVDDAGFELLESIPKYGDDVFELAMKASPQARRAFALNLPELVPLVRRVGPAALELEAKSPGLAAKVFKVFGDDAAQVVAQHVPVEDIPRLLKYADKADSPATRKVLLETYQQEGKKLFEKIPAKYVLAVGLTTAMLYGVREAAAPARAAAKAIQDSPDVAKYAVSQFAAWGAIIILVVMIVLLWRLNLMPWHRKRSQLPASKLSQPNQWDKEKIPAQKG